MEDDEIAAAKDNGKRDYTLEEVFGIIPALPGIETGDFDDLSKRL